jgi:hypothetical protein
MTDWLNRTGASLVGSQPRTPMSCSGLTYALKMYCCSDREPLLPIAEDSEKGSTCFRRVKCWKVDHVSPPSDPIRSDPIRSDHVLNRPHSLQRVAAHSSSLFFVSSSSSLFSAVMQCRNLHS